MTAADRQTLSVVIPTRDVAHLIDDCLDSVSWADEIVVVDRHSSDGTREACERHDRVRVFERDDYIFRNVNFGIDQTSGDWVMRLDSDERVTPELAAEIQTILRAPPPDVTGYEFWERVFVLGRELRHGFGRRHHRKMMFRRGTARYPGMSEHEDLRTGGTWLRTRNGYIHLNYRSVGHYLEKANFYTDADVERMALPAKPPSTFKIAKETARAFYLYYLKLQGFRDGWVGLLDAGMRGVYQFVHWSKVRERWERERAGDTPAAEPVSVRPVESQRSVR